MRYRRLAALLLLTAYLPACMSYRNSGQSVESLTTPPQAVGQVRIVTTTGARIEVWSPRFRDDTLWGYTSPQGEPQSVVFIPASEISGTQVLKTNPWKVGAIAVGAVFLGAMIVAAGEASTCESWLDC